MLGKEGFHEDKPPSRDASWVLMVGVKISFKGHSRREVVEEVGIWWTTLEELVFTFYTEVTNPSDLIDFNPAHHTIIPDNQPILPNLCPQHMIWAVTFLMCLGEQCRGV